MITKGFSMSAAHERFHRQDFTTRSYSLHGVVMRGLVVLLISGGCTATRMAAPRNAHGEIGAGSAGQPILPEELDELTRAFADRYVGLLSSTCDALKKDNPDPVQRREAQELMLNCASNVYDIASNADAFTRMLDLVVVTTLVSQVWIDDDRAGEVFGDRGEVLVRALHHGRVEAWALAGQVLRPDQLDLLDYMMWDWRRHNPDMVRTPFVRFSNFAIGRGKSATAAVVDAGGFANIGRASKSVDEARLLSERMFYLAKREPALLRWETEALKDDILATPDIRTYLTDVHRLTDQAEKLPENVAAERQAIVSALDERMNRADKTVASVKGVVNDANALVASLGPTSNSMNDMLKTADGLFGRYDAWSRWSVAQKGRPFDVREYTEGMKELSSAVEKMNDLLKSSNDLLGSPEWTRRIEQVNQSADGRMAMAIEQSQLLVHDVFRRVYLALGVLIAILVLNRVIPNRLTRRVEIVPNRRNDSPSGNGNGSSSDDSQHRDRATSAGKGLSQ
jgi:hypothetical protein